MIFSTLSQKKIEKDHAWLTLSATLERVAYILFFCLLIYLCFRFVLWSTEPYHIPPTFLKVPLHMLDSVVLITSLLFISIGFLWNILLVTTQLPSTGNILSSLMRLNAYCKFFEFSTDKPGFLPNAPSEEEKYQYVKLNKYWLIIPSAISFICIQISLFSLITNNILLWPLLGYFGLSIMYFVISFIIELLAKDFDMQLHTKITEKWKPLLTASIDIFLPTAGEPLEVLKNTWEGVLELKNTYKGAITVYCLDDANRPEVKALAIAYEFIYIVRPNRGWFKKAGNLRYGFKISSSKFITIFDADFRPGKDFFEELLPYFYEYTDIGLVQSPQFFDVHQDQNWIQRGAGAVQELFYRFSQVSRQKHHASICVGSNAIYRRAALNEIGGTALIEHSEDVHTGFNLQLQGWRIQYVPVIVAKGLCPSDMKAFFKQQYRWCCGSMSLLSSDTFWKAKLTITARLAYISGFLYYIFTAITALLISIFPLIILMLYPKQVSFVSFLLIAPSCIFTFIIYPLWHQSTYGIEAWSTRLIYSWAHVFAIFDTITERIMSWQPTGSKINSDIRYISFRVLQIVINFIPSLLWVYISATYIFFHHNMMFVPMLLTSIYFFFIISKITFYHTTVPALSS